MRTDVVSYRCSQQTTLLIFELNLMFLLQTLWLLHDLYVVINVGCLEYQAQSPDEGALVSAARNFGFVFKVTLALCV